MKLFNLMGIHKLPITNHGSLQNPKQGSLKNHPSTKSRFSTKSQTGIPYVHPKKVPFRTSTKSQTWVICTPYCYPKISPYKIPNLRVMPICPKKALLQKPLCTAPKGWHFVEETRGGISIPLILPTVYYIHSAIYHISTSLDISTLLDAPNCICNPSPTQPTPQGAAGYRDHG